MDDVGASREMCGDDFHASDGECPLCRGEASPEFVDWAKMAAAHPGQRMTSEEAIAWLGTL
jgi:hypothetical protein